MTRPMAEWSGPDVRAPLVVWNARMVPSSASIDLVCSWLAVDGWLVLAAPGGGAAPTMRVVAQRTFVDTIDGLRLDEHAEAAFVVQTLRPS